MHKTDGEMRQRNDFRGYKVVTVFCMHLTRTPLSSITIAITTKKDMSVPESKLIFF